MEQDLPKHIEEALLKRRDEIICQLDEEGFKLGEIQTILEQPLTTQRIHQIITKNRSEKLNKKEGE